MADEEVKATKKTKAEEKFGLVKRISRWFGGDWGTEMKSFKDELPGKAKTVITGDLIKNAVSKEANIRLLVLIVFILIFYVGNRINCDHKLVTIDKLHKELDDVRKENLSFSSQFMEISKQSSVEQKANELGLGLKESNIPPYKLK